jgi:endothelin-converting enzyme/putative endopeptidase
MSQANIHSFAALLLTVLSAVTLAAEEPVLPYTPSLDVTAMDRSVEPCVDFY